MGTLSFSEPTILYVDDQPSHLALFKRAFLGDYLVLTASNAEEGLKILKEHDIFLVIADHHMPQMTGVDFLNKAKALSPKVRQAILSAYTHDEVLKEVEKKGYLMGLLQKPWKVDQMRQFVRETYQNYLQGTPPARVEPPVKKQAAITVRQMTELVQGLEAQVDKRGARRIFLRNVEPPLKKYVAEIRHPAPEWIQRAHQAVLKGNIELFQSILSEGFQQHLVESSRLVVEDTAEESSVIN
ncbi:MAG: response regulator [Deltaproteobacteria bacterium]|nr:response regulator [Deltaproteobacteria bacterium]